jgi:hypothetical protein
MAHVQRVPLPARDQPAVDRIRGHACKRERDREAAQESTESSGASIAPGIAGISALSTASMIAIEAVSAASAMRFSPAGGVCRA